MSPASNIRLTYTTGVVLESIAAGHRYGFDIMDVSGLPDGTVYPALRRLEAAGLLDSDWEDDGIADAAKRPARRYYKLTPSGEGLLAEARSRFPALRFAAAPREA